MVKKVRLRMYYPMMQSLPLSLPVCYQCGVRSDTPLNYIDIEVDPNEIDVEILGNTIKSITENNK